MTDAGSFCRGTLKRFFAKIRIPRKEQLNTNGTFSLRADTAFCPTLVTMMGTVMLMVTGMRMMDRMMVTGMRREMMTNRCVESPVALPDA